MEIDPAQQKKIEKIIADSSCSKDFECYRSGFKDLCKARVVAGGRLVECLEKDPSACEFGLPFGDTAFCLCKLRCYVARRLHK
jgi:hypothetical protein